MGKRSRLRLLGASVTSLLVLSITWAASGDKLFSDSFEALSPESGVNQLGSRWHADADGDGVDSSIDLCRYTYDPAQADADEDGIGDVCEPDRAQSEEGGAITDLQMEHVTPYGAWFTFTSPHTTQWGWDAVLAWSTDSNDLQTVEQVQAAVDRGDFVRLDVDEDLGERRAWPIIVRQLMPENTYHAVMVRELFDGLDSELSNRVTFTTHPAPKLNLGDTRPRTWLNQTHLDALRERDADGDSAWSGWKTSISETVAQAASDPDSVYQARNHCASAAILWLVTDDTQMRDAALTLFDLQLAFWQEALFTGNGYRWADAMLGHCLDLLWDDLDSAKRTAAVEAMMTQGEARGDLRLADTDEVASQARSYIADGSVACQAEGIDSQLSDRACALLEAGLRDFYGMQLVKARRERGVFAQSGGYMPDGTRYGIGTLSYWLQTFWSLHNIGVDVSGWAPFIENNLRAMKLHALTPGGGGYTTFGDLESFEFHFSIEPNSFPKSNGDLSPLAMQFGLLSLLGRDEAARLGREFMYRHFLVQGFESDAANLLLFDSDSIGRTLPDEQPTAFLDSGFDLLHARRDWTEDSALLLFHSEWSGVDHVNSDAGHFQFFRAGRWITNDTMGTDGDAPIAQAHNVLSLAYPTDEGTATGQYSGFESANTQHIMAASETNDYVFAAADTTGAYISPLQSPPWYDKAQRGLLWLKDDPAHDLIIVRDFVRKRADAPEAPANAWRLQFYETMPTIQERQATVSFDSETDAQTLRVNFIEPATVTLSTEASEGVPSSYPGVLYNNRLVATGEWQSDVLSFFSVISITADSAVLPSPQALNANSWIAVAVGERVVAFPNDDFGQAGVGGTIELPDGDSRIWLAGFTPGAEVGVECSGTTLTISPQGDFTADAGGVLALHFTGGVLEPLNSGAN